MEVVVAASPPVFIAILNELVDVPLAFCICESLSFWEESLFEISQSLFTAFETIQVVLAQEHHFDDNNDLISMLLQSQEALLQIFSIFTEHDRSVASQNFDHFICQLEWCIFKLQSFTRSVAQEESEVDVHNVTFDIDQDVSVVSIFYLQDVAYERVCGQAFAEVLASHLESFLACASKLLFEIVDDIGVSTMHFLLDTVNAQSVHA